MVLIEKSISFSFELRIVGVVLGFVGKNAQHLVNP
jgi:hypothetical protein